jgi:hypothetical protein
MATSLAAIARQRSVLATIADAITAAAVGKSLRVAVGWSDPDEGAFADQLTRALLARGLPCRTAMVTGMVAVITSGAAGRDETDLCRVDIRLHTPSRPTADHSGGPDIVVDYLDPDGPIIRHIVPTLVVPTLDGP